MKYFQILWLRNIHFKYISRKEIKDTQATVKATRYKLLLSGELQLKKLSPRMSVINIWYRLLCEDRKGIPPIYGTETKMTSEYPYGEICHPF